MFFEDIDSIKLLERNISKLEGIEVSEAKKLAKMYRIAAAAINQQLLSVPDNTFTEAKLETALEIINLNLRLLEQRIQPQLSFGFEFLNEEGISDSAREINKFEKEFNGISGAVPVDAIIESLDPDNFLFNQYQSSVESYSEGLRNTFQQQLTQNLIQRRTWTQTVNDVNQVFRTEEWKLARIVRTELHQIYNISKLKGFGKIRDDYFPDMKKTMYHPLDSRTGADSKAMAKSEMIVALDKPFVFKYNNKVYRFMAPPNRPNDRAILIPYRESYDKK